MTSLNSGDIVEIDYNLGLANLHKYTIKIKDFTESGIRGNYRIKDPVFIKEIGETPLGLFRYKNIISVKLLDKTLI